MEQYLPAAIMFAITVVFDILFFLPITLFKQKNKTVQFYWTGMWAFMALIAALAGGSNTLMLLGVDSFAAANIIITGVIASFVIFVMFAWARLFAATLFKAVRVARNALVDGPAG